MADEVTRFVFVDVGSDKVVQGINNIGRSSRDSSNAVGTLTSALEAVAAAFAINKLKEAVDTYSQIDARIKVTSKTTEEATQTMKDLIDMSNRTRSSFEATAGFYNKLAIGAKDVGINVKDLIPMVETINKAMIVSGTASSEAKGGLMQFAQGLLSGKLAGEEIRSVLENMPMVGMAIAKGMGVGYGEIRKLAAAGKIQAQSVIQALKSEAKAIDEKFAKMPVTIGQALQVLENHFTVFVGQTSQTSGAINVISGAILRLAENFETVADSAAVLIGAFAAFKIMNTVTSFMALASSGALLAAPFTALIVLLTAGAAWALTFGTNIKISADSTKTYADVLKETATTIWAAVKPAFDWLISSPNLILYGFVALTAFFAGKSLYNAIVGIVGAINLVRNAFAGLTAIMALNPFVLIVGAITIAVGALGYFLYSTGALNNAWVNLQAVWAAASIVIQQVFTYLKDGLLQGIQNTQNFIQDVINAWAQFKQYVVDLWDAIVRKFYEARDAIIGAWTYVRDFMYAVWEDIKNNANNAVDIMIAKVNELLGLRTKLATMSEGGYGPDQPSNLRGYATGGSFTVGGSGGIDSQTVAFMATPGETVTINNGGLGKSPVQELNVVNKVENPFPAPAMKEAITKPINDLGGTFTEVTTSTSAQSTGQMISGYTSVGGRINDTVNATGWGNVQAVKDHKASTDLLQNTNHSDLTQLNGSIESYGNGMDSLANQIGGAISGLGSQIGQMGSQIANAVQQSASALDGAIMKSSNFKEATGGTFDIDASGHGLDWMIDGGRYAADVAKAQKMFKDAGVASPGEFYDTHGNLNRPGYNGVWNSDQAQEYLNTLEAARERTSMPSYRLSDMGYATPAAAPTTMIVNVQTKDYDSFKRNERQVAQDMLRRMQQGM